MTPSRTQQLVAHQEVDALAPGWAYALSGETPGATALETGHGVRVRGGRDFALLSVTAPCPPKTRGEDLENLARRLYLSILERAAELPTRHLVRVWNFIPRILDPLGDLEHTYMAFNTGRYRAYRRWFGEEFPQRMPTASGVGHPGDRLTIHALASTRPGVPVENPRQHSSHRYSRRYGPHPPCFARAIRVDLPNGRRWLLAGGTASVRGERTVHPTHLEAQIDETFLNLAALVAAATRSGPGNGEPSNGEVAARLDSYRLVRVYLPAATSAARVDAPLRAGFRRAREIEIVTTELCRPDLMIEIEGTAELHPCAGGGPG